MPPRKRPAEGMTDTWGRRNRKHPDKPCEHCGEAFRPQRATSKYCSRPCMWANNGKHNRRPDGSESWWPNPDGYIEGRVWIDGRPVYYRQHRYLMEQHLGRALAADEDVHHVNGFPSDNRVENLVVLKHGEHSRLTNGEREYARGYKLNLTTAERQRRAERMREMRRGR